MLEWWGRRQEAFGLIIDDLRLMIGAAAAGRRVKA
jgi:hypothetical protein